MNKLFKEFIEMGQAVIGLWKANPEIPNDPLDIIRARAQDLNQVCSSIKALRDKYPHTTGEQMPSIKTQYIHKI